MRGQELEKARFYSGTNQEHSNKPERLQPNNHLGIIIEDSGTSEYWAECFHRIPNFVCLTPKIDDRQSKGEDSQRVLQDFFLDFDEAALKRVSFIIVDQFYDNGILRRMTSQFIDRFRKINKTAYILEISWEPGAKAYRSDEVIDPKSNWHNNVLFDLLEKAPQTLGAKLQTLKTYVHGEFIEAQLMENPRTPKSRWGKPQEVESFQSLATNTQFAQALKLIEVASAKDLSNVFKGITTPERRLLLHHLWNLVGHLQLGTDSKSYSGTISRIKTFLEEHKE